MVILSLITVTSLINFSQNATYIRIYIPRTYDLEYLFDNNLFDIDTLLNCFVSQFISEGDIYLRLLWNVFLTHAITSFYGYSRVMFVP